MGFFRRGKGAQKQDKGKGDRKEKQRKYRKGVDEASQSSARLNISEIKELMLADSVTGVDLGLKRMEAYIERPVQRLLRGLLEKGVKTEILPTYDLAIGFRYKDVEEAFEEEVHPDEAALFLERLSQLGILQKSFFDSVSTCPSCGSASFTQHFRCPRCGSHQIVKSGLIEHIPCGSIEDRDKYYKGHLQPTCPKCGVVLEEGKFRDMGLWYVCSSCMERFERPSLDLVCRGCGNKFELQTALIKEVSKYSINPEMEQEIRQNVTSLETISKLLSDMGFEVEQPASAIGEKSGIRHNFSLIAKKGFEDRELIVVIDHAVAEFEVTASPLILYTYKLSEVTVDLPIFVAVPELSEVSRRIAQGYNIMVIEGIPKNKEDLTRLQEEIQARLSEAMKKGRPSKKEATSPTPSEETINWILRGGDRIEVSRDREGKFKKIKPGS